MSQLAFASQIIGLLSWISTTLLVLITVENSLKYLILLYAPVVLGMFFVSNFNKVHFHYIVSLIRAEKLYDYLPNSCQTCDPLRVGASTVVSPKLFLTGWKIPKGCSDVKKYLWTEDVCSNYSLTKGGFGFKIAGNTLELVCKTGVYSYQLPDNKKNFIICALSDYFSGSFLGFYDSQGKTGGLNYIHLKTIEEIMDDLLNDNDYYICEFDQQNYFICGVEERLALVVIVYTFATQLSSYLLTKNSNVEQVIKTTNFVYMIVASVILGISLILTAANSRFSKVFIYRTIGFLLSPYYNQCIFRSEKFCCDTLGRPLHAKKGNNFIKFRNSVVNLGGTGNINYKISNNINEFTLNEVSLNKVLISVIRNSANTHTTFICKKAGKRPEINDTIPCSVNEHKLFYNIMYAMSTGNIVAACSQLNGSQGHCMSIGEIWREFISSKFLDYEIKVFDRDYWLLGDSLEDMNQFEEEAFIAFKVLVNEKVARKMALYLTHCKLGKSQLPNALNILINLKSMKKPKDVANNEWKWFLADLNFLTGNKIMNVGHKIASNTAIGVDVMVNKQYEKLFRENKKMKNKLSNKIKRLKYVITEKNKKDVVRELNDTQLIVNEKVLLFEEMDSNFGTEMVVYEKPFYDHLSELFNFYYGDLVKCVHDNVKIIEENKLIKNKNQMKKFLSNPKMKNAINYIDNEFNVLKKVRIENETLIHVLTSKQTMALNKWVKSIEDYGGFDLIRFRASIITFIKHAPKLFRNSTINFAYEKMIAKNFNMNVVFEIINFICKNDINVLLEKVFPRGVMRKQYKNNKFDYHEIENPKNFIFFNLVNVFYRGYFQGLKEYYAPKKINKKARRQIHKNWNKLFKGFSPDIGYFVIHPDKLKTFKNDLVDEAFDNFKRKSDAGGLMVKSFKEYIKRMSYWSPGVDIPPDDILINTTDNQTQ